MVVNMDERATNVSTATLFDRLKDTNSILHCRGHNFSLAKDNQHGLVSSCTAVNVE